MGILTPKLTYSSTQRAVLDPNGLLNVVDKSCTSWGSNPSLGGAGHGQEPSTTVTSGGCGGRQKLVDDRDPQKIASSPQLLTFSKILCLK